VSQIKLIEKIPLAQLVKEEHKTEDARILNRYSLNPSPPPPMDGLKELSYNISPNKKAKKKELDVFSVQISQLELLAEKYFLVNQKLCGRK